MSDTKPPISTVTYCLGFNQETGYVEAIKFIVNADGTFTPTHVWPLAEATITEGG